MMVERSGAKFNKLISDGVTPRHWREVSVLLSKDASEAEILAAKNSMVAALIADSKTYGFSIRELRVDHCLCNPLRSEDGSYAPADLMLRITMHYKAFGSRRPGCSA